MIIGPTSVFRGVEGNAWLRQIAARLLTHRRLGEAAVPAIPAAESVLAAAPSSGPAIAESPYATLQRSGTSKRLMEQGSYHDSYRAGAW
jgi:hypothetical protein